MVDASGRSATPRAIPREAVKKARQLARHMNPIGVAFDLRCKECKQVLVIEQDDIVCQCAKWEVR